MKPKAHMGIADDMNKVFSCALDGGVTEDTLVFVPWPRFKVVDSSVFADECILIVLDGAASLSDL